MPVPDGDPTINKPTDATATIAPISPEQALSQKHQSIPNEVIAAFNELISARLCAGVSLFKQSEVVELILKKFHEAGHEYQSADLFNNHWLDVEGSYRTKGWKVQYDNPGYNESYEPFFVFTAKRKGV